MGNTLSGIDIAHIWDERTLEGGRGRQVTKGDDYSGMHLGDDTTIWCVLYKDMDCEEAWLLEVRTTHRDEHGHTEVVDYLACWSHHSESDRPPSRRMDVEWYNHPRLFFDRSGWFIEEVERWFVSWVHDQRRDKGERWQRRMTPEHRAGLAEYNRKIVEACRARATLQGVRFEVPDPDES